jgi:hypothetical protein
MPRIQTSDGRLETVQVPTGAAGQQLHHAMPFEALPMALFEREMPVKGDSPLTVTRLGFDDTSSRNGHDYITI